MVLYVGYILPAAFVNVFTVIVLLIVGIMVMKSLFDRRYMPAISAAIIGALAIFILKAPAIASSIAEPFLEGGKEPATPAPTTPVPSPEVTSSPTGQVPEITLPVVNNLDSLWIIPILLVAIFIIYLLFRKVTADTAKARQVRKQKAAAAAVFEDKWQKIVDQHNTLKRKVLHAETDWDTLFTMPSLSDPSFPATHAMLRAMRDARNAEGARPRTLFNKQDIYSFDYPKAVRAFAEAWDKAETQARRLGQSAIPAQERKKIKSIRSLLALAEGSPHSEERKTAYGQALKMIESLQSVVVPQPLLKQLEHTQLKQITTGEEALQTTVEVPTWGTANGKPLPNSMATTSSVPAASPPAASSPVATKPVVTKSVNVESEVTAVSSASDLDPLEGLDAWAIPQSFVADPALTRKKKSKAI